MNTYYFEHLIYRCRYCTTVSGISIAAAETISKDSKRKLHKKHYINILTYTLLWTYNIPYRILMNGCKFCNRWCKRSHQGIMKLCFPRKMNSNQNCAISSATFASFAVVALELDSFDVYTSHCCSVSLYIIIVYVHLTNYSLP